MDVIVQVKYNQTARNQPAPPANAQVPSVPGVPATPATGSTAGPAPASDNFVQLLAQSEPQQRKQLIGEQLYRQIYSLHPELTGKITGTCMACSVAIILINVHPSQGCCWRWTTLSCCTCWKCQKA